jgi:hypothetical protein
MRRLCPRDVSAVAEPSRLYGRCMTTVSFGAERAAELLGHPGLVPPPVAPGPPGGLDWLRAGVARFATGEAHMRRRAQVGHLLDAMDLDVLRLRAEILTCIVLDEAPLDVMSRVARDVPVRVLAESAGLPEPDVAAVRTIAAAYLAGEATAETDAAVAALVAAFGGVPDELTAASIGLLVQACEATAALIGNALADGPSGSACVDIAAQLRDDPPVKATIRIAATGIAGTCLRPGDRARIELDGSHPFGAGPHACPGREQAIAIAIGVCEALLRVQPSKDPIAYEALENLRIPARIDVAPIVEERNP